MLILGVSFLHHSPASRAHLLGQLRPCAQKRNGSGQLADVFDFVEDAGPAVIHQFAARPEVRSYYCSPLRIGFQDALPHGFISPRREDREL